jgi:hypothetical protein
MMADNNKSFDFESDWGEYKKNSKKKTKHRETKDWRFDKRQIDDRDDQEYDRKTKNW